MLKYDGLHAQISITTMEIAALIGIILETAKWM